MSGINWEEAYSEQTERVAKFRRENAALRKENAEWRELVSEVIFDHDDKMRRAKSLVRGSQGDQAMIAYRNPFQQWLWESGAVYIPIGAFTAFFALFGLFWLYCWWYDWMNGR